jgi:hypothetical protein
MKDSGGSLLENPTWSSQIVLVIGARIIWYHIPDNFCPCRSKLHNALALAQGAMLVCLVSVQGYQCPHCPKYYASRRLLRDHMCHHANTYKCPFCVKTCPSPSGLIMHIRYKHLANKPFKCNVCAFAWVGMFTYRTDCGLTAWFLPEVSALADE